jgi:glycosyltransferase involved in cell wall biosynthesis
MRVLILTHSQFPPDIRIEKEISSLLSKKIEVTVIANKGATKNRVAHFQGAQVVYVRMANPGIVILDFRELMRVIRKQRYDAIQVCDAPLGPVAVALSRFLGLKLLYDAHEMWTLFALLGQRRRIIGVLSTPLTFLTEGILVHYSQKIVASSRGISLAFPRYYGCPRSKIVVVRNLPYLAEIPREQPPMNRSESNSFTLVYVGGIDGQRLRELSKFIEAMGILKDAQSPRYALRIIGAEAVGSPAPWKLTHLAKRLEVSDRIEFLGWIPLQDALREASEADLALIGSEKSAYTDLCLPHKLCQYVQLGLPVLSADLAEVKMTVGEKVSYYHHNDPPALAQEIERVQKNIQKLKLLASGFKEEAERTLTWEVDEGKYQALFSTSP